jgi:hypothetical protein
METIATIKNNEAQNGIEIYFKVYPLTGTKETLKKNGFRWNHKKACWYAIKSMTTESIADIVADTTLTDYEAIAKKTGEEVKVIPEKTNRKTATKAAKKNKYGVKIGDVFSMSWGYEQTNNNFFQVVALAGESSVRIVEVLPKIINRDVVSPMAEDITYNLKECVARDTSCFIKDQENGDLKRVKPGYNADRLPIINMTSYANAYLEREATTTVYDSNYY